MESGTRKSYHLKILKIIVQTKGKLSCCKLFRTKLYVRFLNPKQNKKKRSLSDDVC